MPAGQVALDFAQRPRDIVGVLHHSRHDAADVVDLVEVRELKGVRGVRGLARIEDLIDRARHPRLNRGVGEVQNIHHRDMIGGQTE